MYINISRQQKMPKKILQTTIFSLSKDMLFDSFTMNVYDNEDHIQEKVNNNFE